MMGTAFLESPTGATALLEWGFGAGYRNEGHRLRQDQVGRCRPGLLEDRGLRVWPRRPRRAGTATAKVVGRADSFEEMFRVFARAGQDAALRERLYLLSISQAGRLEHVRAAAGRAP